MTPLVFNLLLACVGSFLVVGLTAVPALAQWPARPRPVRASRPRRASAAYRRPAPAFGGAYA